MGMMSIHPYDGLGFPSSDIRKIDSDNQTRTVTFMGLYGVDSPLPLYFLALTQYDHEQAKMLKAFLDIFNQRFYELWLYEWKMYYEKYLGWLQSLSNIHGHERSVQSLTCLLQRFLCSKKVRVECHFLSWVPLSENLRLGDRAASLGDNMILGECVLDVSQRIDIHLGPWSLQKLLTLMSKQPEGQKVQALLQNYLGHLCRYRIILHRRMAHQPDICLGVTHIPMDYFYG